MKRSTFLLVCFAIAACLVLASVLRNHADTSGVSLFQPEAKQTSLLNTFCLAHCPSGASATDTLVLHHILELENNPKTKFADWVAYRITAETLGHGCKRIWARDPDLPADVTLDPRAYRGAHEALASDRGHQAPLASLCGSTYWYEADYLSNITPQKSALNQGAWEHLENGERQLIKNHFADAVYSITGTLYEREMPKLPNFDGEHRIPSGYWKVISVQKSEHIIFVAFVMEQTAKHEEDYCVDHISIEELERRAHLLFFPALSAEEKILGAMTNELMQALGC